MISILYVDDEPGLLELCRIFLEQTGEFRVNTAESAEQALAELVKTHYDAIISDYQMPVMDGISLLKSIRQRDGDIPFILFTGRGREEVVIEALNNGADFYLQKGGDPKVQFVELMHKVRQAVDKRQAERDLHESEKRLTDIINFLPDPTFAIDGYGKVIAWNRGIEELTGVPAGEMLGKGDHKYATTFYGHPRPMLIDLIFEPEERIRDHYSGVRRENEILIAETDLPRPLGKQLTLMGKASPLYDRQGKLAGAIESIRDISARKQEEDELRAAYEEISATEEELRDQYDKLSHNEQVLRDSEEKYRTLVENSQDVIYIYRDDHFLLMNKRGAEITGYTHEELMQMRVWDFLHQEDLKRVFAAGKARIQGIDIPSRYTARIVTKSGKSIPMDMIAVLIAYQGKPAIMGIARDVTEREAYICGMANKTKTLTIINRIIQIGSQKRDVNELLDTSLSSILDFLGYNAGGVYLIEEGTARARLVCSQNLPPEFIRDVENFDIHQEPFNTVLISGKPLICENYADSYPDYARKLRAESFASIPIIVEEQVIGALNVASGQRFEIPADERDVLSAIGRELGSAITRTKAEAALQENEEQYRTLVETTGTGFVILDEAGGVIDANPEYVRMTGSHNFEEIRGRSVIEWTAAHDQDRNARAVRDCKKNGSIRNFDVDYVDAAGHITPVEVNATIVNNKGVTQIVTLCRDISSHRRAEEALRAQYKALAAAEAEVRKKERQLREITTTIPGVVFQFLAPNEGTISAIYLSERSRELFSRDKSSLDDAFEVFTRGVHPEDRQRFLDSIDLAVKNRERWDFEGRFIRSSGELFWFQAKASPAETDKGMIYSGVVFDITTRKQAEEALRQSENLYRTLADAAQDLIYIINKDDTIAYINAFAAKMIGRNREDIIDRPRPELFPGFEGDRQYGNLQTVFSTGTPLRVESRVPLPSQDTWQDTYLIPLKNPEGIVTAVMGISRDITTLKQAEEALRSSENIFRSIVDNVQDMLYRTDMEGKITMINPAGAKMAGYNSPEEMIGLDLAQDLYDDPQERRKFLAILSRKGSVDAFPLVLRNRDGHRYYVTASSHYYHDPQGNALGIGGIIHDVTDLRQTENALMEANRKLNLLNSITRHDVANQLTVLQGYTQLAMIKNPDPMIGDFLQKIDSVATTIALQIEFSKTYQELGVHAPGWFNLDEILAKNKPQGILFSSSCRGMEVFADPMLENVFANLFGNSIMHGERVSRITVRCEPAGDDLLITVEDNGVGIPLDVKQKIFKKGFGKHTGFGLFLVREILAITGISIHETGTHGKGARFEITVPKTGYRHSGDSRNRNT